MSDSPWRDFDGDVVEFVFPAQPPTMGKPMLISVTGEDGCILWSAERDGYPCPLYPVSEANPASYEPPIIDGISITFSESSTLLCERQYPSVKLADCSATEERPVKTNKEGG